MTQAMNWDLRERVRPNDGPPAAGCPPLRLPFYPSLFSLASILLQADQACEVAWRSGS